jgi:pimeloyl-ACP methyl ester carboxylesterase
MQATRHTLTLSPNLHLSYLTWGEGTPVVLLHGLADHGLVWQSLAGTLGDRYGCIAPDLRGHGDSSKPPENSYDVCLLAADLEALAAHLRVSSVHVVAHSWAAKVALVWAQQQPHRIRSLVLVDPFFVNRLPGFFRPTLPIFYRTLPFLQVMGPFPTYDAAEAVARTLKQYRGWSSFQASVFQAGMEQKAAGGWGSKFAISARNGVFQDILDQAGLTQDLNIPTGLMLPDQGLNRMAWQLKPYQQHLHPLTIIPIPGNHWPHLVQHQAFNQAVSNFLDSQTSLDSSVANNSLPG